MVRKKTPPWYGLSGLKGNWKSDSLTKPTLPNTYWSHDGGLPMEYQKKRKLRLSLGLTSTIALNSLNLDTENKSELCQHIHFRLLLTKHLKISLDRNKMAYSHLPQDQLSTVQEDPFQDLEVPKKMTIKLDRIFQDKNLTLCQKLTYALNSLPDLIKSVLQGQGKPNLTLC